MSYQKCCVYLYLQTCMYVQPFSAIPNRNSKDFLFSPGLYSFQRCSSRLLMLQFKITQPTPKYNQKAWQHERRCLFSSPNDRKNRNIGCCTRRCSVPLWKSSEADENVSISASRCEEPEGTIKAVFRSRSLPQVTCFCFSPPSCTNNNCLQLCDELDE